MNKLPIFVALDVESKSSALSLMEKTHSLVEGYKLGPRLFLSHPELLSEIKGFDSSLKVFLDFKFYDIPTSTLEAVKTVYELGADVVTVHAGVGPETLSLLASFQKESSRPFRILAVTVLSSVADPNAFEKASALTDEVMSSGLNSIVCSGHEVSALKKKYPDLYTLTPGIRLEGQAAGDQKRVMTAKEALAAGSSALVMGRSLINSDNPVAILENLKKELSS